MNLEEKIKQTKPFRNHYHKAAVNLIYTGKWILQIHAEIFKSYKLTLQQYNILRILRGQYPKFITVKLIRERMLDKMSDASRIVEGLRKKGLLERNIRDTDRRKVNVLITDKGLHLLSRIDKENERMDNFLSALNEEECIQLCNLLDKLSS